MNIATIVVFLVFLVIAYGLSYWAFRARRDRSAYVGLYLLFGFPGVLLVVAGLALAIYGRSNGWAFLAIGLGFLLPLVKPVREFVASFTPMDPASPVDMAGLAILLPVIAYLGFSYLAAPDPESITTSVSVEELIVQVLALVGFAYAAVGTGFYRTFREASGRLGLVRPTWSMIGIALLFMALIFVVNGAASAITQAVQPDLYKEIEDATKNLTANVQNPAGALLLGVSAGVGEELLLRGAVQPRFGIILTSLLFALLHVQYGLTFVLIGLFLTGALLGIERKRYGTTAAIITHAMFDVLVVLAQTAS
ncbi:MAG TPA: CPBP family intramembrane glutamic endopeptidase [Thermomicrobiales bacterium]|nr:CPBP family intramembrane glutamic endopeptidase [Thermomicrobiales bacterium]